MYVLHVLAVVFGILLIILIAQDGFETIVLPRRVARKLRIARMFYRTSWHLWAAIGRRMHPGNRREYYLSYYGPLSLILLLTVWALAFIVGFALLQWGIDAPLHSPDGSATLSTYIYFSGTTFFTLGLGDITPMAGFPRFLTVVEAGLGFGFLALVIGYVPVIYQTFSRREINVSLLDARAGSPPSAVEMLRRHYRNKNPDELITFLREWERWCAELLESHLSYPVLTYYRSQHERQSWLGALTAILDTCALVIVGIEGMPLKPMKFTFAIARHATVDLAQTFGVPPSGNTSRRLTSQGFAQLCAELASAGIVFSDGTAAEKRLAEIRGMYEPFLESLSHYLVVTLPEWVVEAEHVDDWQTSAWDHFLESSPHTLDRAMGKE